MQAVEMNEEVTEIKQPYAAPTLTTLMTSETQNATGNHVDGTLALS